MKKDITKTTVPTVKQFIAAFMAKLQAIGESCRDLYLMADANPGVFDEIVTAEKRFNYNMLESMRRVGAGELYVELLFDSSMAARRLLPLARGQQEKLYNDPVKIVKLIGGKRVIEEKPIQKMSRHELNLVIDDDKRRARTVEEQIAFVQPPPPARRAERYEIVDGVLKVLANTEFTGEQLRQILERMTAHSVAGLEKTLKKNQVA
jgi:hypothetical protein